MRRGGRLLVLLGIILGVMTAGLVFLVMGSNPSNPPPPTTQPVVIALQNIPARSIITTDLLTTIPWPESILAIPQGSFSSSQLVAGKIARDQIYQGEIILAPMVVERGILSDTLRSPAAYVIPENKVAMAFQITPLTGIAGAIQAGDHVDMILTLQPPQSITQTTGVRVNPASVTGTEGEAATQLFLQDILILNVGNWPSGPVQTQQQQQQQQQQAANIITLALERQDAIALKSGRELGQIDLVLRRAGDTRMIVPASIEPVTREYLNRRFNFKLLPAIR